MGSFVPATIRPPSRYLSSPLDVLIKIPEAFPSRYIDGLLALLMEIELLSLE